MRRKNSGKHYTMREIAKIAEMRARGYAHAEIGWELERSTHSVIQGASKSNLSPSDNAHCYPSADDYDRAVRHNNSIPERIEHLRDEIKMLELQFDRNEEAIHAYEARHPKN